jgi:hypothetical protein
VRSLIRSPATPKTAPGAEVTVIDALYVSPWPGILLWSILFISDHSFTIACARMYRSGVREHFVVEGSYEITPFHQRDVDALRRFSPRFWFALILPGVLFLLVWYLANGDPGSTAFYEMVLGTIILLQLSIHVRHLRNYFLFRAMLAGDGIAGRIEYARPTLLKQSAVEMFAFAALYGILFGLMWSWFTLGGAIACSMAGAQHWQLARQAAEDTVPAAGKQTA